MVKGVNKRIIEVVGNDNDYFEKAILFMKPENVIKNKVVAQKETSKYVKNLNNDDLNIQSKNNIFMYIISSLFGGFLTFVFMFFFFL